MSYTVATMSETCTNWSRFVPRSFSGTPAGQWNTIGTCTPPSWVFCLYQRYGVLPHWAQPHG